jgi:hypothetical protein
MTRSLSSIDPDDAPAAFSARLGPNADLTCGEIYFQKSAHSRNDWLPIQPLGMGLANALDKFKAFTPEHHIRRVPSKPREISRMCLAPVSCPDTPPIAIELRLPLGRKVPIASS